MNINAKKSVETFDPFFLYQLPECKRSETGIRGRNIKKLRLHKENIKRSIMIDRYSNENNSIGSRSLFRPNRFMIRSRLPFGLPAEPIQKQQNIAFFNFLPESDENLQKQPKMPSRSGSYRYGRESKYLQKLLKPKNQGFGSEGIRKRNTLSCERDDRKRSNFNDSDEMLQTPNKWTEVLPDVTDEEESPLREYSNVLKPRFNQ